MDLTMRVKLLDGAGPDALHFALYGEAIDLVRAIAAHGPARRVRAAKSGDMTTGWATRGKPEREFGGAAVIQAVRLGAALMTIDGRHEPIVDLTSNGLRMVAWLEQTEAAA